MEDVSLGRGTLNECTLVFQRWQPVPTTLSSGINAPDFQRHKPPHLEK